jgi:mannose-6-phosphate isomerase-like protein (cupin superfamily)
LRAEHRLEDGLYDFIDLTTVPAGHSIGSHTHEPDDEEVYVVIDGRGLMQMDGREFEVGAGDVIVNRRGGTHGLTNIGQDDLRLVALNVRAPPGANDLG